MIGYHRATDQEHVDYLNLQNDQYSSCINAQDI